MTSSENETSAGDRLFQIKHRFTSALLFELRCRSLRVCIEAGVKADADPRERDSVAALSRRLRNIADTFAADMDSGFLLLTREEKCRLRNLAAALADEAVAADLLARERRSWWRRWVLMESTTLTTMAIVLCLRSQPDVCLDRKPLVFEQSLSLMECLVSSQADGGIG